MNPNQVGLYPTRDHPSSRGVAPSDNLSILDQGHLQQLAERQLKKNKKVANALITSPLSVALHALTSSDATDSLTINRAILARCKKPGGASVEQIIKNHGLILWDHPLILACVNAVFNVEIQRLRVSGTAECAQTANSLEHSVDCITGRLMRDQLKISAPALASSFATMFQQDPSLLSVHGMYESARGQLMSDPANRIQGINRVVGVCIDYSIKGSCTNNNCSLNHTCIFCNGAHPSYRCQTCSNRWKPMSTKKSTNTNNNSNYRGRRRYNNRHHHRYNDGYNGWNQGYPPQPNQGYPWFQPPNSKSKDGNQGRYSQTKQ